MPVSVLACLWRYIKGACYYGNWADDTYQNIFFEFLANESMLLPNEKFLKFNKFVDYLKNHYFSSSGKFNYNYWNYSSQILRGESHRTNNVQESLNRCLKANLPRGTITLTRAVEAIKQFKVAFDTKSAAIEVGYILRKRSLKQVTKDTNLKNLLTDFEKLNDVEKTRNFLALISKLGSPLENELLI